MSPARCGHCGGQAISYQAHLVNLTPTRLCDHCGHPVRKKGFWSVLVGAAVAGGAIGYFLLAARETSGGVSWIVMVVAVAVLLGVVDYLAWRLLPWAAEEGDGVVIEQPVSEPAASRHTPAGQEGQRNP